MTPEALVCGKIALEKDQMFDEPTHQRSHRKEAGA
jgi:hypothetical protein